MQISVHKSEINGIVLAPASKSYTIRALMCAALTGGKNNLFRCLSSDDTEAALNVLQRIGISTETDEQVWQIQGNQFCSPTEDLYCRESAATLRFMTAICSQVPGLCCLTAGSSLAKRPVKPLVDALKMWGADVSCEGEFAPVTVRGGLKGGMTEIPGNISSQFVSALLLVAPLAQKKTSISLTAPLESRSYVLMTLECLQQFGICISHSDDLLKYEITPQKFINTSYVVEGDWSSASYLLALGALAGQIKVRGLNLQSLQGDKEIVNLLNQMGASIKTSKDEIIVEKSRLKAIHADLNECIDLLPTMVVLAALAEGTSEFTGIRRARLKESNRVSSVSHNLMRAGIRVVEEQDKLTITGNRPQMAIFESYNDHRIAMAFSLMGVAAGGVTIHGAECVTKTYPGYWDTLRILGAQIDEQ